MIFIDSTVGKCNCYSSAAVLEETLNHKEIKKNNQTKPVEIMKNQTEQ